MKRKSPVLAILLVLTVGMTAVNIWYFTMDQSVAETAGQEAAVEEAAHETTKSPEAGAVEEAKNVDEVVGQKAAGDGKAVDEAKMQEAKEKVESEFDTVSTTLKTPGNVAKSGSREKLPSGEVVCTLADGTQARNIWAEDEEGKLSYFGYDGCLVKNNFAPDGFFAGAEGVLDESVSRISGSQGKVLMGEEFVTDTSNDPLILFEEDPDKTYECLFIKRYSFGYDEVFGVMADPDSAHAYLLKPDPDTKEDFKDAKGALMTITDDGKTLIVSDCGITEKYHIK